MSPGKPLIVSAKQALHGSWPRVAGYSNAWCLPLSCLAELNQNVGHDDFTIDSHARRLPVNARCNTNTSALTMDYLCCARERGLLVVSPPGQYTR